MSWTLAELVPDGQSIRTIQMHEPADGALGIMLHHDFSQLPVVQADGKTSAGYVVTFSGVIQALQAFGTKLQTLQVRDVAQPVRTYQEDADLLATLDDIQRANFALIVDEADVLAGIVTTADTTAYFREYAQDLMQIEGIESRLKEAITTLYASDANALQSAIEKVTDRHSDTRKRLPVAIKAYVEKANLTPPNGNVHAEALAEAEKRLGLPVAQKSFDALSFDEFTQVLLRHTNAPKLTKAEDTAELRILLERVRNARNKLAHFRGDLSPDERRIIAFAAEWLDRILPAPPPPPSSTPVDAGSVSVRNHPTDREDDDSVPHGSYSPLALFLRSQEKAVYSVTLTFPEIEKILGKELPRSAFEYRAWWANDPSKPQSIAWLDEGWRTTSISMSERRLTFVRTNEREDAYISFFAKLQSALAEAGFPVRGVSPQGQSWLILASLNWTRPEAANISASFTRKKEFRIELYLDSGDKETNKKRFEELFAIRSKIEGIVGQPLSWERLDAKRSCRVAVYTKAQISSAEKTPELIAWATRRALDFLAAFGPEFPKTK